MIKVDQKERIRRAYYVERKSIRAIAREFGHSRRTVKKAIESAEEGQYTLKKERAAPVLGEYKERIEELLRENEQLPAKQKYSGPKIYEVVKGEGYEGSESGVLCYLTKVRKGHKKPKVFLPLEYDPGVDAQVDWGEAQVILKGEAKTVQLFVMRLCYSRRIFVMVFPSQKQESFFAGHVAAFKHFEGVPHRLTYDNLKAAVSKVLKGRNREEQKSFVTFCSHYLFERRYCGPGQGHEKGGVEHGVGYARRNFMVPLPQGNSYEELNEQLRQACLKDDHRRVARQERTIKEMWQEERFLLRSQPEQAYDCCQQKVARLNPYGQVVLETNRYSVPVEQAEKEVRVKLYPFRVKIYGSQQGEAIAVHPRCYEREQDIFDPLHYLGLLARRPGALEHAKPIREWREQWPAVYEQLLRRLQQQWPEGRGIREFIGVLQLHQSYPGELVAQAVKQALSYNCAHADGVELCLRQLVQGDSPPASVDLSDHPHLKDIGQETADLGRYDQLLGGPA